MKAKKTLFYSMIIILILFAAYFGWQGYARTAPAQAAETFITALTMGDLEQATEYAAGSVLYKIKASEPALGASVTKVKADITNNSDTWAEGRIYAETLLKDGSCDVGWYHVEFINDNSWKVVAMSNANPWVNGWSLTGEKDTKGAKEVFDAYLKALADNRYREAGKYLCGTARQAHEKDLSLSKTPLLGEVEESSLALVWQKANQMVCEAGYKADGRDVEVFVRFIKLNDGWHIVQVV